MDFNFTESSLGLNIYCTLLFILMVLINWNFAISTNIRPQQFKRFRTKLLIWGVLILSVTCFIDADFFHYQQHVKTLDPILDVGAIEYVYLKIIELVERNYFLFRLCVWGGALYIIKLIFKRLELDVFLAFFILLASYIFTFAYARASLAMAVYFYGLSFLIKCGDKRSFFSILVGLFFIILSYEFHHSILILIILTPIIYCPLKKTTIILAIFILPFVIYLADYYFVIFANNDVIADDYVSGKLARYSTYQTESLKIKGVLRLLLEYSTFYIPLFITTRKVLFKSSRGTLPAYCTSLSKISFGLIYIATLFLFFNLDSLVFFYRILYMSFIPLTVLICILYQRNQLSKRSLSFILSLGVLSQLWKALYAVYIML